MLEGFSQLNGFWQLYWIAAILVLVVGNAILLFCDADEGTHGITGLGIIPIINVLTLFAVIMGLIFGGITYLYENRHKILKSFSKIEFLHIRDEDTRKELIRLKKKKVRLVKEAKEEHKKALDIIIRMVDIDISRTKEEDSKKVLLAKLGLTLADLEKLKNIA